MKLTWQQQKWTLLQVWAVGGDMMELQSSSNCTNLANDVGERAQLEAVDGEVMAGFLLQGSRQEWMMATHNVNRSIIVTTMHWKAKKHIPMRQHGGKPSSYAGTWVQAFQSQLAPSLWLPWPGHLTWKNTPVKALPYANAKSLGLFIISLAIRDFIRPLRSIKFKKSMFDCCRWQVCSKRLSYLNKQ